MAFLLVSNLPLREVGFSWCRKWPGSIDFLIIILTYLLMLRFFTNVFFSGERVVNVGDRESKVSFFPI